MLSSRIVDIDRTAREVAVQAEVSRIRRGNRTGLQRFPRRDAARRAALPGTPAADCDCDGPRSLAEISTGSLRRAKWKTTHGLEVRRQSCSRMARPPV